MNVLPIFVSSSILILSFVVQAKGALNVVTDYDFADNTTPAGFSEFGDPTYAAGKITLDGDGDYLQINSPLGATTSDNFVLEAIVEATGFGAFNFVVTVAPTTGNGGYGTLAQGGGWGALTSGVAFAGTTAHDPAPTGLVSLAYVMENGDASLYVNGVRSDNGSGNGFTLSDPSVLSIGAHPFDAASGNGFFIGDIDRVRVSTFSGAFDPGDLLGPGDGAAPLGQPFLTNAAHVLLSDSNAEVSVDLSGSDADVNLYWADSDYGDTLADWQTNGNTVPFGQQTDGSSIVSNGDLTGLLEDTRYYYRFHAVNASPDPVLEGWSPSGLFVATPILTKTVTDLSATADSDSEITLTWTDAFSTETSYFVERSEDGVTWAPLTSRPEDSITFTDSHLIAETTYSYRILGSNDGTDSDYSNVAMATTTATPAFTPTIIANYDFEDNATPAGFTEFGDPTYAGGQLKLDGDGDYLQISAPSTPTDNFVLEAVASADGVGAFNFIASISDASGVNSGYGIVAQSGNWNALTSGVGFPGATEHGASPTPAVSVAYVRERGNSSLYVNGFRWDSGGADATPTFNDAGVLTIGGHAFDAPAGLFDGCIDQVRLSTFVGSFDPDFLLSATGDPNSFSTWIAGFDVGAEGGFLDDPDGDRVPNGLENFFGTDPSIPSRGSTRITSDGTTAMFRHPQNTNPASDIAATYQWSRDLVNWFGSGDPDAGTTVTITPTTDSPAVGVTSVSGSATGIQPSQFFLRIIVSQSP